MSLDISSDSKMIITGSADKNIKIWGLDFGDCHKSIFAHNDSIMTLGFVPGTHYFFSAGKDKMIKYWDGDKFEQILSIPGHHGEVCTPPPPPRPVSTCAYLPSGAHHARYPSATPAKLLFKDDRQFFLHFSLTYVFSIYPWRQRNSKLNRELCKLCCLALLPKPLESGVVC
jgi:WD40 repeat protein